MSLSAVNPPATVGFIGLGNMGYPMATRLSQAGYKLVVSDLNSDATEKFCAEAGARSADLQTLGTQSDVVITMLPEGKAVREVLLSDHGVMRTVKPGAIMIDMSSCSPVETRALGKEIHALGFVLIDAPVSGGVVKAIDGSLAIMAGGDVDCIGACRPLLEQLGKLFLTGESGTGHAMKAMNNYLSAATLAVTSEAVLIGEKFGLDPATMVSIINASTGRSNSSEQKFPAYVLPRTFDSGFFLGLMAKDLRFARELGESMESPHILLDAVTELWDAAEAELGFNADNIDVYRHLESRRNS